MTEEESEEILFYYARTILDFEKALRRNFNLPDHPWGCRGMFPRHGVLNQNNISYEYRFHGGGCTFQLGSLEVGYDYLITQPDYLLVSPWKFGRFVTTFLKLQKAEELSAEEITKRLEQLCSKGIINRVDPKYHQYQIRFDWMRSFTIPYN